MSLFGMTFEGTEKCFCQRLKTRAKKQRTFEPDRRLSDNAAVNLRRLIPQHEIQSSVVYIPR